MADWKRRTGIVLTALCSVFGFVGAFFHYANIKSFQIALKDFGQEDEFQSIVYEALPESYAYLLGFSSLALVSAATLIVLILRKSGKR